MNKKQAFFVLFVCFLLILFAFLHINVSNKFYKNNQEIQSKIIFKLDNEKSNKFEKEILVEEILQQEILPVSIKEPTNYYDDVYTVTAYCSCRKCCGRLADNRPVDKNGVQLVYGASGALLWSGYSVASPLPFGTIIEIDGYKYEVQDRTSKRIANYYGGKIIDIYFNNHEEAINWGSQEKVVKIYE